METLQQWLEQNNNAVEALVMDVDGILIKGRDPVPGAVAFIDALRERCLPFALLTNDGCHAPEEKATALRSCGMPVAADDIVSSSHGLFELADDRGWRGDLFYLMGHLGTPCYAHEAGLRVTQDPGRLADCTGVLIGEQHYDWMTAVTAVFNHLVKRPTMPLIAPNPDRYYPTRPDWFGIGSGAVARFVQDLCTAHGVEVEVIFLGKPFEPIFAYNHHRLERRLGRTLPRSQVMMVGDSLASDILGGKRFGYRTALVMTGITTAAMLAQATDVVPDHVFDALTA